MPFQVGATAGCFLNLWFTVPPCDRDLLHQAGDSIERFGLIASGSLGEAIAKKQNIITRLLTLRCEL
jgi:hypothetical protein